MVKGLKYWYILIKLITYTRIFFVFFLFVFCEYYLNSGWAHTDITHAFHFALHMALWSLLHIIWQDYIYINIRIILLVTLVVIYCTLTNYATFCINKNGSFVCSETKKRIDLIGNVSWPISTTDIAFFNQIISWMLIFYSGLVPSK